MDYTDESFIMQIYACACLNGWTHLHS